MPASVPKVQFRHPQTGRWWLVNTDTGRVIKSREHRWPDVEVKTYEKMEKAP